MATIGLQDRSDSASNYVIWKARISFLLAKHDLKTYAENIVAKPIEADQLKEFKKEMDKAKQMTLDGVRDNIVSHISAKNVTKEMWDALTQQ